jgi:hypothetical protein
MRIGSKPRRMLPPSRLMWFIAMLIGVSMLGMMHRYRGNSSNEVGLILLQSTAATEGAARLMTAAATAATALIDNKEAFSYNGEDSPEASSSRRDMQAKKTVLLEKLQEINDQVEKDLESNSEKDDKMIANDEQVNKDESQSTLPQKLLTMRGHSMTLADTDIDTDTAIAQITTTLQNSVQELNQRPVHFMRWGEVDQRDAFSASWLQKTDDFLSMRFDLIRICEDAAFKAFFQRHGKVRMTLDWLDFSIEHLSKVSERHSIRNMLSWLAEMDRAKLLFVFPSYISNMLAVVEDAPCFQVSIGL